jgi:hypothetical protein
MSPPAPPPEGVVSEPHPQDTQMRNRHINWYLIKIPFYYSYALNKARFE